MRTCLVFLIGLLPAAGPASVSAQPAGKVPIKDFARAIYFEGVPYDEANAYTSEVVPVLVDMLQDEAEAPYWSTVAVTLSIVGDGRAADPLIDFIQRDVEGGLPDWLYNAKGDAVMALGYLVNKTGDRKTLNYLLDAVEPDFWNRLGVGRLASDQAAAQERKANLSTMAILGLALSGTEEAAQALDRMLQSESTEVQGAGDGVLEEARAALDTISKEGLSEYYRKSDTEVSR